MKVCSQPAIQNSGDYSVEYFQRRMIRSFIHPSIHPSIHFFIHSFIYSASITPTPITPTPITPTPITSRWIKLRSSLVPLTMVMEPVSEWLLLGLVVSWAVNHAFQWSPLAFFLTHSLAWFILDYVLLRIVQVAACFLGAFLGGFLGGFEWFWSVLGIGWVGLGIFWRSFRNLGGFW